MGNRCTLFRKRKRKGRIVFLACCIWYVRTERKPKILFWLIWQYNGKNENTWPKSTKQTFNAVSAQRFAKPTTMSTAPNLLFSGSKCFSPPPPTSQEALPGSSCSMSGTISSDSEVRIFIFFRVCMS